MLLDSRTNQNDMDGKEERIMTHGTVKIGIMFLDRGDQRQMTSNEGLLLPPMKLKRIMCVELEL